MLGAAVVARQTETTTKNVRVTCPTSRDVISLGAYSEVVRTCLDGAGCSSKLIRFAVDFAHLEVETIPSVSTMTPYPVLIHHAMWVDDAKSRCVAEASVAPAMATPSAEPTW